MIVSRKHKFIYIGINKTGTTSIENALNPYRNRYYHRILRIKHSILNKGKPAFKHVPARIARQLVGKRVWENSFKFTFVRNPWARTLSEYTRHRHNEDVPLKEGFTQWVLAGGNWLAVNNNMSHFVTDNNNTMLVDFVGKLENIENDLAEVCKRIGIDVVTLPHLNKSKDTHYYREMYNDETRRIVTEWVAEDAERFGYEF